MDTQLKKQSLLVFIILSFVTIGIYPVFWFKKQKKITDNFLQNKKLSGKIINIFFVFVAISSLLYLFYNIYYAVNVSAVNELAPEMSQSVIRLLAIVNLLRNIMSFVVLGLMWNLSFKLRDILQNKYNVKLSKLGALIGPIYLQDRMNHIISGKIKKKIMFEC